MPARLPKNNKEKMMRQSLYLRKKLHDSIEEEIAERIQAHQAEISAIKSELESRTTLQPQPTGEATASAFTKPLCMLAHGDSWFDYPLRGNLPSAHSTDVIAQLEPMLNGKMKILNISHYGDATTNEMSLPKQQRMIEVLQNPDNWLNEKNGRLLPDAILFSGGGNDIAGIQFCIFLDYAGAQNGLNEDRFKKALGMVEASYRSLFAFRDRYAQDVPIFAHTYDYPIPNNVHPWCAGPWLHPSLEYCGYKDIKQGTDILKRALSDFRDMLAKLADPSAGNNFFLIDTLNTLTEPDWANELHPHPDGFKKIAAKFVNALNKIPSFEGRLTSEVEALKSLRLIT